MKFTLEQQFRAYLGLAVFYYCGLLFFVDRLLKGGRGEDLMAENASGNLARQLLGLLLLAWGLGLLCWQRKSLLRNTLFSNVWWILLISFLAVSIAWSYEPAITLRRLIAFATLFVSAAVLVSAFDSESLLRFLTNTLLVVAAVGVCYSFVDPSQSMFGIGDRSQSFKGIMFDKNAGARMYAYGFLLLLGLGRYRSLADKFSLGLLFYCVVAANSATALVMLVGGTGLFILLKFMHTGIPRLNVGRVIAILCLISVATLVIVQLYAVILETLGRDPTLTNRAIIWELMDEYIADEFWLGYGFGAFWASDAVLSFVERWGFIGNAHSGYYEVMLHGGAAAMGLMVLMLLTTLKQLFALYVRHPDGELIGALITIVSLQCVVNYVGYVILNHNSTDMFLFTLVSLVAGFLFARSRQSGAAPQQAIRQAFNLQGKPV